MLDEWGEYECLQTRYLHFYSPLMVSRHSQRPRFLIYQL